MKNLRLLKEKLHYLLHFKITYYNVYAIFILIVSIFIVDYITNSDEKIYEIKNEWSISYNGNKEVIGNICDFKFDMANAGDTFILKRNISSNELEQINFSQVGIMLEEPSVYVRAWVDNKLIFKDVDKKKYIISLDKSDYDKELKIEYQVIKNNSFSALQSIHYIDENCYVKNTIKNDYLDVFIGGFLFLFGLTSVLLTLFKRGAFFHRILFIGLFLICLSGWVISNNKSFIIFSESIFARNLLKYYSIFYGTIHFSFILNSFVHHKIRKNILYIMSAIDIITVLVSSYITLKDNSLLFYYITIIEIIGLVIILTGSIFIGLDFKKQSYSEKMMIYAFTILAFSMCYEAVRDLVIRSLGRHYTASYGMKLGLILFITIIINAYIKYAMELLDEYVETEELSTKAYQDVLTGLDNRAKVMAEIEKLTKENSTRYCIINFDLNDLKKINDSHGHKAGDTYLCIFSDILKKYLGEEFKIVGRIGGDEFVAISENYMKTNRIDNLINKIERSVTMQCADKLNVKATFAYGYVTSNKNEALDFNEAYQKADKMMYDCKKRQKDQIA